MVNDTEYVYFKMQNIPYRTDINKQFKCTPIWNLDSLRFREEKKGTLFS